jgi:hypothetical protein
VANINHQKPIIDPYYDSEHLHIWHSRKAAKPYDSYSVRSLTVMEAFYFSEEWKGNRQEGHAFFARAKAACEAANTATATPEQQMLAECPYDLCLKDVSVSSEGPTHVVMDLSATDEQILSDFRHWLSAFRKVIGITAPVRNFDERHFKDWIDNQVLPYTDLTLWAKANNTIITQNTLGEALFPDADSVDTTERVRRTVKPKAEHLLREETARALQYQSTASLLAENLPAEEDHEKMPENKE